MNPIFDMPLVCKDNVQYRKTTVKELPNVFLCKEYPLKAPMPLFFIGEDWRRVFWISSGHDADGNIVCRCQFEGDYKPTDVNPDEVAYIEEVVLKWKK